MRSNVPTVMTTVVFFIYTHCATDIQLENIRTLWTDLPDKKNSIQTRLVSRQNIWVLRHSTNLGVWEDNQAFLHHSWFQSTSMCVSSLWQLRIKLTTNIEIHYSQMFIKGFVSLRGHLFPCVIGLSLPASLWAYISNNIYFSIQGTRSLWICTWSHYLTSPQYPFAAYKGT